MTTTAQRYLTDEQIASYHRDGYLAIPRLIDAERVDALRRVTDAFVERSRGVTRSDGVFDLDPRHTPAAPVLRRIKNPPITIPPTPCRPGSRPSSTSAPGRSGPPRAFTPTSRTSRATTAA